MSSPELARIPAPPRRTVAGASRFVLILIALWPLTILLTSESAVPFSTRLVGWLMWVVCFVPSWTYLKDNPSRRRPIPFVPLVGILYAWYYARPLVFGDYNEHWRIRVDPATDYVYPAQLALEGLLAMLLGFKLAAGKGGLNISQKTVDPRRIGRAAVVLACLGLLAQLAQLRVDLPVVVGGIARLFHTLGYLGMGLLVMEVTAGMASPGKKVLVTVVTVTLLALQLSTGFLSGLVTTSVVVLLSYWAVRRRLSIPLCIATLVVALMGLTVKSSTDDFRNVSWRGGGNLSASAKASVFAGLVTKRIANDGIVQSVQNGWRSSARRSANMDLLADIVRRTPDPIPYWLGKTYVSLVGFAIPRIVWPSKPTKNLGQQFGHRYALLDTNDTQTSFNLPFLVEFYANFGEIGVAVGMLIVGTIYGFLSRIANNPGQDPLVTIVGIVLMLPLLNIESDFSLIFGGLFMDGLALWALLRYIRRPPKRDKRSNARIINGQVPALARAYPVQAETVAAITRPR